MTTISKKNSIKKNDNNIYVEDYADPVLKIMQMQCSYPQTSTFAAFENKAGNPFDSNSSLENLVLSANFTSSSLISF